MAQVPNHSYGRFRCLHTEILSYTGIAIHMYFIFFRAQYLNLEKHFFQPKHLQLVSPEPTAMQSVLGKKKGNSFSDFGNPFKNTVKNKLKTGVMCHN